jgi:hypothetical protein
MIPPIKPEGAFSGIFHGSPEFHEVSATRLSFLTAKTVITTHEAIAVLWERCQEMCQ